MPVPLEYVCSAPQLVPVWMRYLMTCTPEVASLAVRSAEFPDGLEPYDAMSGRFERAVEMVLQPLLKAVEMRESGVLSETVRDRLNFAAKLGLIENVDLWLEMRAARNRIAHDYLPERIKAVHDLLMGPYRSEIEKFLSRFDAYVDKRRKS